MAGGPGAVGGETLRGHQIRSLQRIVTALGHAMNNIRVILLIQARYRRLLF